ncbi:MAG: peptidoglycan recognition protein family protein [Acidimicrobiia bacterium]|nr:peptidoglycan recognition protein family protein [Acidimicrobiia bacterium]
MTEATAEATPDFDQLPELDQAVESRLRPEIRLRSTWDDQRSPTGPLEREDDVRFLLIHHTASTNDYGPDEVIEQIHDFYALHVGPERGWPDLAYNFLIDRFGGIWEARQGSLTEPIRGDATGGSQGFAQLVGLIGNHLEAPPTAEAVDSLTRLLAWMAHRYRIDTTPGATAVFSSRGSNRWPAGTEVTAATISGHRDMSLTTCPGDAVHELLDRSIPQEVERLRQAALVEANAELDLEMTPSAVAPDTMPPKIGSESVALDEPRADEAAPPVAGDTGDADRHAVSAGATMVIAGLAGLIALRRRRIEG